MLSLFTVQQLNQALKLYPERQAHRQNVSLPTYHFQVASHFTFKLRSQCQTGRVTDCQLSHLRVSTIAGTPIIPRRPEQKNVGESAMTAKLAIEEMSRALCTCQSDSGDYQTKLGGQLHGLGVFVDRSLRQAPATKPAKVDVFTRLYGQTPARYKANPASLSNTRPVSTAKVSQLKQLFTAPDSPQVVPPRAGLRLKMVMSSKIKSLAKTLIARTPNLLSKLGPTPNLLHEKGKANGAIDLKDRLGQSKRQLF